MAWRIAEEVGYEPLTTFWDDFSIAEKFEEVYLPGISNPIMLKRGSPELTMLQRIRDEAHRFAITFHRKLRTKAMIRK